MHVAALLYPPLILLTVRSLERHLHNWRTTSDHTCHLKRQEHTGLLNCFEGIVSVKPAEIPLLRSHDLLPAYHMPGTRLIILYTLSHFSILPTAGKTAEAMGAYSVLPKVTRLVLGPAKGLNPKAKLGTYCKKWMRLYWGDQSTRWEILVGCTCPYLALSHIGGTEAQREFQSRI